MRNLLIADSGNTCRGPLAEVLLNNHGDGLIRAWSETVSGEVTDQIDDTARKVIERTGVSPEDIQRNPHNRPGTFHAVIAIDRPGSMENQNKLADRYPDAHLIQWVVRNPQDGDTDDYEAAYEDLALCVRRDLELNLPSLKE